MEKFDTDKAGKCHAVLAYPTGLLISEKPLRPNKQAKAFWLKQELYQFTETGLLDHLIEKGILVPTATAAPASSSSSSSSTSTSTMLSAGESPGGLVASSSSASLLCCSSGGGNGVLKAVCFSMGWSPSPRTMGLSNERGIDWSFVDDGSGPLFFFPARMRAKVRASMCTKEVRRVCGVRTIHGRQMQPDEQDKCNVN